MHEGACRTAVFSRGSAPGQKARELRALDTGPNEAQPDRPAKLVALTRRAVGRYARTCSRPLVGKRPNRGTVMRDRTRSKLRFSAAVVTLGFLLSVPAAPALAQEAATVTGRVTNAQEQSDARAIRPSMDNVRLGLRKAETQRISGDPSPDWTAGVRGGKIKTAGGKPEYTGGWNMTLPAGRYELATLCSAKAACPAHRLNSVTVDGRALRPNAAGRYSFVVAKGRRVSIAAVVGAT